MRMNNKEIDTLIVNKLFEWDIKAYNYYGNPLVDKYGNGMEFPFSPSTVIENAWEVVNYLKDKVEFFNLDYEDGLWNCEFGREYSGANEVSDEKVESAICKAALKAVDFKY